MKKLVQDIAVVMSLLIVMLVFCGFKGETTICGNPHDYTVKAEGEGCSVQEISTKEQAVFDVAIAEGKDAKVTISGALEGEQANIAELSLKLSEDVACSELITEDVSATRTTYRFDLGIPDDMADGTQIEATLQVPNMNDSSQMDDVATIRLIVRRIVPAALPGTGDHGGMIFWLWALVMSGAVFMLMRRKEN